MTIASSSLMASEAKLVQVEVYAPLRGSFRIRIAEGE
jgi:hypothetical protein